MADARRAAARLRRAGERAEGERLPGRERHRGRRRRRGARQEAPGNGARRSRSASIRRRRPCAGSSRSRRGTRRRRPSRARRRIDGRARRRPLRRPLRDHVEGLALHRVRRALAASASGTSRCTRASAWTSSEGFSLSATRVYVHADLVARGLRRQDRRAPSARSAASRAAPSAPMTDPKERFSSRVDDYVRYRPGYPAALFEMARARRGCLDAGARRRRRRVGHGDPLARAPGRRPGRARRGRRAERGDARGGGDGARRPPALRERRRERRGDGLATRQRGPRHRRAGVPLVRPGAGARRVRAHPRALPASWRSSGTSARDSRSEPRVPRDARALRARLRARARERAQQRGQDARVLRARRAAHGDVRQRAAPRRSRLRGPAALVVVRAAGGAPDARAHAGPGRRDLPRARAGRARDDRLRHDRLVRAAWRSERRSAPGYPYSSCWSQCSRATRGYGGR